MESIRPDELSSIIKEQIKRYEDNMNVDEIGNVVTIGDGIALIYGLNNVMAGELLAFDNDVFGMALNLEQDSVGAVLMGDISNIKEGDIVKRTGEIVKVPVGDALLGRVVNAIGQPVDGLGAIAHTEMRPVERVASGVMTRKSVTRPLQTGIKAIDGMIPIGRGQRELIIGDRETGKTTIAIDTIINQKGKGVKCVYVAIGQKNSTVAQIVETLRKHDALAYTTIVLATASELAPLQYIAPYSGCAIGEYWMDNGEDVLLVYDDLSKHAVAYRTLSLLLRRPPGREAYPGDVFYLHSRLLERAAQLNEEYGGGSLTALPIIETLAGDISAYIPTNVISITDGQIFLKSDFFNAGQRPAIDSAFSVSRVGSAAQVKAMKQVAGSIKLELAQYQELEAFSQFGSDLDAITQEVLDHGAKVLEILKQLQGQPKEVVDQVIIMYALKKRLTKPVPVKYIKDYETALISHMHDKHSQIVDAIINEQAISDDLDEMMLSTITAFTSDFVQTVVE